MITPVLCICTDISVRLSVDRVSLPYDHTYQHIFHYGIYTKLRSSLLPLSVTWHSVPGGIDIVWVRGHWRYIYVPVHTVDIRT